MKGLVATGLYPLFNEEDVVETKEDLKEKTEIAKYEEEIANVDQVDNHPYASIISGNLKKLYVFQNYE